MGKVKISELPVASVVNPTDLIEVVQGGTNKQVVSSLIGGNQTLAQVLANGDTMNNGQFIKSPNGKSTFTVQNGSTEQNTTNVVGVNIISNGTNGASAYLGAEDATNSSSVYVYPNSVDILSNVNINLSAPLIEVSQDPTTILGISTKQYTDTKEATSNKNVSGGYVGLTLFKINFKNVLNTFTSFFTNSNTASRTYTFKDADGTIAFTSDITGTNSGTNTGDETASRIATINHGTSAKTTLVDADEVTGQDSANSFSLIRTLWSDVFTYIVGKLSASTTTFTNKTIKKRILVVTQSATPSTNIDNGDIIQITGLAQAITSMSSGLSGTPYDGQLIEWQITDNGTARALTWGASFTSTNGGTLPITTVISTMLRVLTQYNGATTKHECIAVS